MRFESTGRKSGLDSGRLDEKSGAPAWDREPRKARSVAGVVFTPARGVIHPSFPLRGRWGRSAETDQQAPSPSLVSLHISSDGTRPRCLLLHGLRQCVSGVGPIKLLIIFALIIRSNRQPHEIRLLIHIGTTAI